jgi:hypothetical protein
MAKKFNIHEWQAKQRRLYEQEDSETGNTSDETLSPLEKLVERVVAVMDGRLATWQNTETIKSSHDMMALMKRDKEKIRMMVYNLLRDDFQHLKETNTTGTGATVSTGAGEAFATPSAFAKPGKWKGKKTTYTENVDNGEEELEKDAQKVADHPLVDKVNTRDEWEDLMQAIIDHGEENISQVNPSVMKTFLMNALRDLNKPNA